MAMKRRKYLTGLTRHSMKLDSIDLGLVESRLGFIIEVLDLPWMLGFAMDFWIHDGFLGSQCILGFMRDFWIRDGFLDS